MPKAWTGGRRRAVGRRRRARFPADPGMGAFMATQTAPAVPFPMSDYAARPDGFAPPARPRPRVLWPWPVFFLGAAALDRLMHGDDPDSPFERFELLARAHMRVPSPNYVAALEATQQGLAVAPPNGDPKVLTEARLRMADLQLRLGRTDDAIRALE